MRDATPEAPSPDPTPYHPDLAPRARFLPRGVAHPWMVPFLAPLTRLTGAASPRRGRRRVAVGRASVFVHRPPARPSTEPGPAMLWLHGGGYVSGDARHDEAILRRFVDDLGMVVASAQYRLAPRHPFPAALDDGVEAFDWLAAQPDVDGRRIVVGGLSAGGGLAAALARRLVDRGGAAPSFQLLTYPMLDDRTVRAPHRMDPWLRIWDAPSNRTGWSAYLGSDRGSPPYGAVPARTDDLAGLPPAWIGVGDLDLFHDEALAYAARLRDAGVEVVTEVVPGAYHGFDVADAAAPVSRSFADARLRAVAEHLDRIAGSAS